MAIVKRAFKFPFEAVATFEPWREKLGEDFDQVVAILSDRDRALEDYLHDHDAALDALLSQIADRLKAATVATGETTTSTSFTDLTTAGPAVTVTVGPSGKLLLTMSASVDVQSDSAVAEHAIMSFTFSGANTLAAADSRSVEASVFGGTSVTDDHGWAGSISFTRVFDGLNAGDTTITCKYRSGAGDTVFFKDRTLVVQAF